MIVAFRVFDGELETRFRRSVGHLTYEIIPRGETGEGSEGGERLRLRNQSPSRKKKWNLRP